MWSGKNAFFDCFVLPGKSLLFLKQEELSAKGLIFHSGTVICFCIYAMDPHHSPRKQPSDSFRRNPYASPRKKPLERSPTKKADVSPIKKPQETKKLLSPRKEPNYETSPKRKAAEGTQRKLQKNDSSPTKEAISPRKKPADGKRPRKERATKTLEVVDRDNWKFPSERTPDTQPEDEIAKPKKKEHPLIQEYDPDVHGAEFERTLVLIKPTALHKSRAVEQVIKRHGLLLLKKKRCRLRPDTVRDFYLGSLDEQDNR
ncbi:hypothetical protein JTE90_012917 [Oedothorax gibbosus]|nr:hypothetical protein JTE90_012917 [Oedothorax gibbosus]